MAILGGKSKFRLGSSSLALISRIMLMMLGVLYDKGYGKGSLRLIQGGQSVP